MPCPAGDVQVQRRRVPRMPAPLFASRIRKAFTVDMPAYPREDGTVMRRAIALWKQHARCLLGDTAAYPGRIAILFDRWFTDAGYRAAIARALGVAFDDRGFGRVGAEGGGSSFDGTRFDGDAGKMAVTDRVGALAPHERALLDTVLADPDIAALQAALRDADVARLLPGGVASG